MKRKLLPILALIAVVLISKAEKLAELGDIWPTLTTTEKLIAILAFVLIGTFFFAVGWVITLGWTSMRRGLSRFLGRRG